MILFYFPDKTIHQVIPGFGAVTEQNGTYWIDNWDTTTQTSDVSWKYISEQVLESDENGMYVHNADYYPAIVPEPTLQDRIAAAEDIIAVLIEG
jgi:hypothetical protein